MSTRISRSASTPSPHAVPVVVYDEPMVEFFPRNAEAGARYFWPNRATADRIAQIKATMLAKSLQQAQQALGAAQEGQ